MDNSGVIQGPPLPHHPASLFMLTWSPSLLASPHMCLNKLTQAGLANGIGPLGVPWSTSMIITPPIPTRLIASRSAVIPLLLMFPFNQNQKIQGRAEGGGWA